MFDALWVNLHAATMKQGEGFGIIENAAIGITDGKIVFIGKEADLRGQPSGLSDYVFDGEGKWATPGLIDCHTHLAYAGSRAHEFEARLKGKTYEEITRDGGGIASTVKAVRDADEEEIYDLTINRLRPLAEEGVPVC